MTRLANKYPQSSTVTRASDDASLYVAIQCLLPRRFCSDAFHFSLRA